MGVVSGEVGVVASGLGERLDIELPLVMLLPGNTPV